MRRDKLLELVAFCAISPTDYLYRNLVKMLTHECSDSVFQAKTTRSKSLWCCWI